MRYNLKIRYLNFDRARGLLSKLRRERDNTQISSSKLTYADVVVYAGVCKLRRERQHPP